MLTFNSKIFNIVAIAFVGYMIFYVFSEMRNNDEFNKEVFIKREQVQNIEDIHENVSKKELDKRKKGKASIITIPVDPETMEIKQNKLTFLEKAMYLLFRDKINSEISKIKQKTQ